MAEFLTFFDDVKLNRQFQEILNNLTHDNFKNPITFPVYTDSTRPDPGIQGRVIFNSDDGNLNIDNGTDWILPDGTTT